MGKLCARPADIMLLLLGIRSQDVGLAHACLYLDIAQKILHRSCASKRTHDVGLRVREG